ncbi:MAG: hypothetical protein HYX69_03015 [Planctomycetia bacterium]|nr:hypothetical protein [Planctomycetia bacterium]
MYAPISTVDPSDAAARLEALLKKRFPTAKIEIVAAPGGLILDGTVADPNHISRIVQIAEFFHPKVLNNLTVAGVQVLVKVKVVEINATRLQSGCNCERGPLADYGSPADILRKIGVAGETHSEGVPDLPPGTARVSPLSPTVINADSDVFGLIEALCKADLAKIIAEPNVVSCSGRPASFVSGGEFPVCVMRGEKLATEWRKFGTEVEIVNSIIGEKQLRVDAKVRVSAIDPTRSVKALRVVDSTITVPALQVFEVNTGFEANSGQTFVLAGLTQLRDNRDNKNKGDKAAEEEIIRLVLITPLLVEAQEATVVARPAGEASSTSAARHPDSARQ